jgi:hypothetical protein
VANVLTVLHCLPNGTLVRGVQGQGITATLVCPRRQKAFTMPAAPHAALSQSLAVARSVVAGHRPNGAAYPLGKTVLPVVPAAPGTAH